MLGTISAKPLASSSSAAIIAFEPRQVTLAKHQIMKNKKLTSETLETTTTTTNDAQVLLKEKKKKTMKKDTSSQGSSSLLLSIAAFLDTKGFSKTLKAFKSEAALTEETDGLKGHLVDLEEVYNKYIETSNYGANVSTTEVKKLDIQIEQVAEEGKEESKAKRKESSGNDDDSVNGQPGVSNGVTKLKKRKIKSVPDVSGENPQEAEPQMDEPDKKPKDKKKKKNKNISESSTDNIEQAVQEALPEITLEKTTDEEEKNVKSKDKKTKKKKSGEIEEDSKKIDSNVEKKDSKKRKRLSSEEQESQSDGKTESKESKEIQTKGLEEDKRTAQMQMENTLQETDGHAGKKRKIENGQGEKSTKKQPNGSAEPKSANAFKRVDVEKVEYVDERLQDNSYWAKDGADIGYGAKAQEVLGQVRGRDFRHEKTKKKRGSYRGGQIDLESHSIKFNYADED